MMPTISRFISPATKGARLLSKEWDQVGGENHAGWIWPLVQLPFMPSEYKVLSFASKPKNKMEYVEAGHKLFVRWSFKD